MQPITIEATRRTPEINFDPDNGYFYIKGRSLPVDVEEFYIPLLCYLEEYLKTPQSLTIFNFELSFFSTASTLMIYNLLKLLNNARSLHCQIIINWIVREDDEDIIEHAQDFADLLNLDIRILSRHYYLPLSA